MFIETGKLNLTADDMDSGDTIVCHQNGSINYSHYDQRARLVRSGEFHSAIKRGKIMLLETAALFRWPWQAR